MFGGLATDIHLDQDLEIFSGYLGALLEFGGQFEPVHGLNHIKPLHRLLGLVGLQTTDEMPLPTGRHIGNFRPGLLDPVFPKKTVPQPPEDAQPLGRNFFAHGQQPHGIRTSSVFFRRLPDFRAEPRVVLLQRVAHD